MDREIPQKKSPRILVIRRDNIGDLVCTTPLLTALRQHFPNAWIGVWANSYNAPVLDNNPDIDAVFVYTKAKHRSADESLFGIFWKRMGLLRQLRNMQLDDVVIATTTPQPRLVRMARWLNPKRIIAFGACGSDVELPLDNDSLHEVEDVMKVARFYGYQAPIPACKVIPSTQTSRQSSLVAVHISARKPSQRWPTERFAELLLRLHTDYPTYRFRLFWAPGAEDDIKHPGDDSKACAIINALGQGFPLEAYATTNLQALISGLAECSAIICADGGAMHVAAGLGLPVVCLFGNSGANRWRPWGVPYQIHQKSSLNVSDINTDEVCTAFNAVLGDIQVLSPAGPA